MKRILFLVFFTAGIVSASFAQSNSQDYKSAIGARLGSTYYDLLSFSYKSFITEQGALELNAGFGSKNYDYSTATLSAAISYQHHFDIKPAPGLKWFVGGGLTVFNTFSDHHEYEGFGFGIFPTGGVDYKFNGIPLNVSADVRPTIHVVGPSYYNSFYGDFGIAARYTLGGK
jgi:hypothetical protein